MTFIVFEGGDGVGKTTQLDALGERLRGIGRDVLVTCEPGGTTLGKSMRELLLHSDAELSVEAELYLLLADRAQHVSEVIRPALDAGTIVLCDRFTPSSLVYQAIGRKLGVENVERAAVLAEQGVVTDLVLVLDLPDDRAATRMSETPDRLEREGPEFHQAVREGYRALAKLYEWKIVDGSGPPEEVHDRVYREVRLVLP